MAARRIQAQASQQEGQGSRHPGITMCAAQVSAGLVDTSGVQEKGKAGHQGGAVDESLDRTNTEMPAAAPNLPRRARARGKAGRR